MAPLTPKKTEISMECGGCPQKITNREYLICSSCKVTYDLLCGNVSISRFLLMDPDKKITWRCQACICKKPKGDNSNTPVGSLNNDRRHRTIDENVTLRKPKKFHISLEDTLCDSSDENCLNDTISSETSSLNKCDIILNLRREVENLTEQLIKANDEIKKLSTENTELKQKQAIFTNEKIQNANKKNKTNRIEVNILKEKQLLFPDCTLPTKPTNRLTSENTNSQKPKNLETINLLTNSTDNKKHAVMRQNENQNNPRIIIIGDQSCKNVSSCLINQELQNKNGKIFEIITYIHPGAPGEYILKNSVPDKTNIKDEDWIILSLGSNDSNPVKLLDEMSTTLKRLQNNNIIVVSITNNLHLNEDKLNSSIHSITKRYDSCKFLQLSGITNKQNRLLTKMFGRRLGIFLQNMMSEQNMNKIDKDDFTEKTGTIPYFFKKMNNMVAGKNNISNKTIVANTQKTYKIGTIPYYFKKIAELQVKNIHNNVQNDTPNHNQLFHV